MLVTVTPFEPDSLPASLDERTFEAAGRLLGATGVELVTESST